MPIEHVNGIAYHFLTAGSGPPLVLLHGFTGSSDSWSPIWPGLTRRFRVFAPDLLGHGQTDAPADARRYAMEPAARDLIQLLGARLHEPVHLLGYSMGGRLALYLALTYPHGVRSLILESASPGLEEADARHARRESDEALAYRIEEEGIPSFVDAWSRLTLFSSQSRLPGASRRQVREIRLQNRPQGLANSLRGMGTGVQPSLWSRLTELALPVLLISGELDRKFCTIASEMAAQLRFGQQTVVAEVGHTVHLEAPEEFVRLVEDFLAARHGRRA